MRSRCYVESLGEFLGWGSGKIQVGEIDWPIFGPRRDSPNFWIESCLSPGRKEIVSAFDSPALRSKDEDVAQITMPLRAEFVRAAMDVFDPRCFWCGRRVPQEAPVPWEDIILASSLVGIYLSAVVLFVSVLSLLFLASADDYKQLIQLSVVAMVACAAAELYVSYGKVCDSCAVQRAQPRSK